MSNPTTSNNQPIDPALVRQAEQCLRMFNPDATTERLSMLAVKIAAQTQAIMSTASNHSVLQDRIQVMQQLCSTILPNSEGAIVESTIVKYNEYKAEILSRRNLDLSDEIDPSIEQEVDAEIQEAIMKSMQAAQELAKQTCRTCHKPNQFIENQKTLLQRCIACKEALYCSRDCQKRDWPQHKNVCIQK